LIASSTRTGAIGCEVQFQLCVFVLLFDGAGFLLRGLPKLSVSGLRVFPTPAKLGSRIAYRSLLSVLAAFFVSLVEVMRIAGS